MADAKPGLAATGFAAFRGAFLPGCDVAVLRSPARRFRRAFFFACPLRRFIFIELRRSCLPTAGKMPLFYRQRQALPRLAPLQISAARQS